MRVVSGRYRGMVLNEFKGRDIRPTSDRVKVSLFNILMYKVAGAAVLDLFCGSGSLGIECLSRGAKYVAFNDISQDSIKVAQSNLKRLGSGHDYSVTCSDYAVCLNGLKRQFDIIFIDPPYADNCGICALEFVAKLNLLAKDGVAVYERDRPFAGDMAGLEKYDERKYGKTYLTFFKKK
ncbi:MAG: 16S rRNA (guanine(966)-N(2))-methyltransferase RsmD [Clostridia bacterium]|nr:16S rRNA (guanine(966)-N(2))-methyltransferase RsmD [Clostridia bacterium]